MPVIVTTWRNTKERIRELIDIGADGLLIKPISNNAIQSHVNFIVNERKPFVVTSSYIGPDCRKDPKHTSNVPLIEVPNTLKAKIDGEPIDFNALRQQIMCNNKQVNDERLRRNAFELSFLVELALAGHASEEPVAKLRANLRRLHIVVGDTIERMRGSDFEDSTELCETLARVVKTLVESETAPASVDLQRRKPRNSGSSHPRDMWQTCFARHINRSNRTKEIGTTSSIWMMRADRHFPIFSSLPTPGRRDKPLAQAVSSPARYRR